MKFAQGGAGFTPPVDNPVLLASENARTLSNFFYYQTPFLDIRAFQSYAISIKLEDGTMTDTDIIAIHVSFYMEFGNTSSLTFNDSYYVYKTNLLGSGVIRLTDVCHGSWMTVAFVDDNSVDRTVNLSYLLYGSYRPTSNTFLRTASSLIVYQNRNVLLGAGVVGTPKLGVIAYGPAVLGIKSGAGGGATIDLTYGGTVTDFERLSVTAANTIATKPIVLPREQLRATVTNNGAGVSTIDSYVALSLQPL